MASARTLKKRIKSTKNIAQITKAMEAVSAVKMRRSQEVAIKARPYALAALEILKNISSDTDLAAAFSHPLLETGKGEKQALIVITSDKGLCGSFNSNVLRKASDFLKKAQMPTDVIAVGKRGRDFLRKRGYTIASELTGMGDYATSTQTKPLAEKALALFTEGGYSAVFAVYTNFISVLKQEVVVEQVLPFSAENIKKRIDEIIPQRGRYANMPAALGASGAEHATYKIEPSPAEVLSEILPLLLETNVYHMILEANASEHSARMVAMKNASENAKDLISDLTLVYNKARQANITKELAEISAGAAALENSA
jgi:F-type H+-transporting ATPase subunit gamma